MKSAVGCFLCGAGDGGSSSLLSVRVGDKEDQRPKQAPHRHQIERQSLRIDHRIFEAAHVRGKLDTDADVRKMEGPCRINGGGL